jgi:hypothetical protein
MLKNILFYNIINLYIYDLKKINNKKKQNKTKKRSLLLC